MMLIIASHLGTMIFGLTRDVRKGGRLVRVKSTEAPVVVERPNLRIVTDDLWQAVASRRAATCHLRRANGQLLGKPERSTMLSHYLLSGLLECPVCHGPMVVSIARPHGGADEDLPLLQVQQQSEQEGLSEQPQPADGGHPRRPSRPRSVATC